MNIAEWQKESELGQEGEKEYLMGQGLEQGINPSPRGQLALSNTL